jgi:hypothetical protein
MIEFGRSAFIGLCGGLIWSVGVPLCFSIPFI